MSVLTSESSQVRNLSLGNMEQAPRRGHKPSLQSGLGRAASGVPVAKKKLRGLGIREQAQRITPLSFFFAGVSSFLSPPRSAMRRGAWKCNTGSR